MGRKENSSGFTGMGSIGGGDSTTGSQMSAEDIHTQGLFARGPCEPCGHVTQEQAVFAGESEECHMERFRKQESVYI